MSLLRVSVLVCALFQYMSLAGADEFTEQVPIEERRPIRKMIKKLTEKPRKCFKCRGEGHVVMNVKEPCDECDGTGIVVTDRQIKDTKHSTDGYWNFYQRTTRTVQNKQPCKKCGRSGKMNVKKEVTCTFCKGVGQLTKSGKPYVAKSKDGQAQDDPEPERN